MDMSAAIGSAVASGAMDVLGGYAGNELFGRSNASSANEAQMSMARYQYNMNRDLYQERYQNTANDMRAAGLNPILAASGGFQVGQPSVSLPSAAMAPNPAMVGFGSSARAFSDVARNLRETDKAGVEIQKMLTEIPEIMAKTKESGVRSQQGLQAILESRSKQGVLDAEEKNLAQQVRESTSRVLKMIAEVGVMTAQVNELNSRAAEQQSRIPVNRASAAELGSRSSMQGAIESETRVRGLLHSAEMAHLVEQNKKLKAEVGQIEAGMNKLNAYSNVYSGTYGEFLAYAKESVGVLDSVNVNLVPGLRGPKAPRPVTVNNFIKPAR